MVKLNQDKINAMLDSSTKWAYWIVGILIVGGISHILFNRLNKQVAAVLVFLAGMLALYFYYVKWFVVGLDVWPPFQVCPDFLTPVAVSDGGPGKIYCANMVGTTIGTLSPLISDLHTRVVNGPPLPKATAGIKEFSATNTRANCDAAKNAGLTWISLCGSS
jgi:hypothetical protein